MKNAKKGIRQKDKTRGEMDGETVRTLREDLMLMSQARFGALLGVEKLTVLRWETDKTTPSEANQRAMRALRAELLASEPLERPAVFTRKSTEQYLSATRAVIDAAVERWSNRTNDNG